MNFAARLQQRVTFQTYTETSDGHGGFTETARTVRRRVAAEVVALIGRDLERGRQIDPRASHLVTVRYWHAYPDDLVGGRVIAVWHDGGRDRELEAIEPPREVVHRVELAMTCKEAA